ncbi:hypothetical protein ACU4GD_30275 [Cupriavidus basilensis]
MISATIIRWTSWSGSGRFARGPVLPAQRRAADAAAAARTYGPGLDD